jgi:hypothetical protein
MNSLRTVLCIGCAVACVSAAAAQIVVYNQPNDDPDGMFADGVPGVAFNHTRTADNFSIADDTFRRVTQITWWGSAEIEWMDIFTFTDWVVIFYDNNNGLPGDVLYAETIPADNITFTPTGDYNMDGGEEFQQTARLTDPPTLSAHTTYWFSIGAVYAYPEDGYRWSLNYGEGNGHCARDILDLEGFVSISGDLAFVLVAEAVGDECPQPGAHGQHCTADIDFSHDCVVDLNDLAEMLGSYGYCPGNPHYNAAANIATDGDPCINLNDLAELLGQYGDNCN